MLVQIRFQLQGGGMSRARVEVMGSPTPKDFSFQSCISQLKTIVFTLPPPVNWALSTLISNQMSPFQSFCDESFYTKFPGYDEKTKNNILQSHSSLLRQHQRFGKQVFQRKYLNMMRICSQKFCVWGGILKSSGKFEFWGQGVWGFQERGLR